MGFVWRSGSVGVLILFGEEVVGVYGVCMGRVVVVYRICVEGR